MPRKDERLNRIITKSLRGYKAAKRHPCEVTADRLGDHLDRYPEAFDGATRDEIAHLRYVLQEIAIAERGEC